MDKETARDLAICGGIVSSAVAIAFSLSGASVATHMACQPIIEPAPEVLRPAASDTWFLPPMALDDIEIEKPRKHGRRG